MRQYAEELPYLFMPYCTNELGLNGCMAEHPSMNSFLLYRDRECPDKHLLVLQMLHFLYLIHYKYFILH